MAGMILEVQKCVRCGGNHPVVEFRDFRAPSDHWSCYARCDGTLDPAALGAACRKFLDAVAAPIPDTTEGQTAWEQACSAAALEVFWASGEPILAAIANGRVHQVSPQPMGLFGTPGPLADAVAESPRPAFEPHEMPSENIPAPPPASRPFARRSPPPPLPKNLTPGSP